MANSVITDLFTEKFRPKDLASLIAPPRIKNELSKGLIQNVLFYGTAGTGKSTTLKILSDGYPTLFLNAREEANMELLRTKLPKFCSSMSLDEGREKLKCVAIDEMDGAPNGFFDAIKVPIEKYSNRVRFIGATNYIQNIPDPVLSRFNCISFDPINAEEEQYVFDEYKKRISAILNAAKITYTEEILLKFIKNDFPDMRRLMVKTQSFYLRGVKELNSANFNINYDYVDLYNLCLNKNDKPYENYQFIVGEYGSRVDDALYALGNDFIEFLKNNMPVKIDRIPFIIIAVAEHQAQRTQVIDPLITLLSCVYKIQTIIHR